MQSIDLKEPDAHGMSQGLIWKKEKMKRINIIKQYKKMINSDDAVNKNIKVHNPNWPQISDHPYRILIIGGSGSGKTNSLFNLINHQSDNDKIYLYAKGPYEAKHQSLIKKCEDVGAKHFNDSKAFIEYSNKMVDIYKNIEDYNAIKKSKTVIVFDDMVADRLRKNLIQ